VNPSPNDRRFFRQKLDDISGARMHAFLTEPTKEELRRQLAEAVRNTAQQQESTQ